MDHQDLTPKTMEELKELLTAESVDTSSWRKPLTALWKEIKEGDSRLIKHKQTKSLLRVVDVVRLFCFSQDRKLQLIEDRQVFTKSGEIVKRGYDCLCEKARIQQETFFETAKRALQEELQIDPAKVTILPRERTEEQKDFKTFPSPSYGTLMCSYTFHDYEVVLPDTLWKKEYVETQSDKSTYFLWKSCS